MPGLIKEINTPANIVTLIRILLIPIFVVVLLSPWTLIFGDNETVLALKPWIAALVFAILAATDAVDGYLARSRNEITDFGKLIDPLADKILVCAALLALIELQELPSWIVLIIIAREFMVSGLRMLAASRGLVIAASWTGKCKTCFQIIAVICFIIKDSSYLYAISSEFAYTFSIISWIIMIIAVILTIISGVEYFVKTQQAFVKSESE